MSEMDEFLKERRKKWEKRMKESFEKIQNKKLRILVELYYDIQKLRVAHSNRLGLYRRFGFDEVEEYEYYINMLKNAEDRLSKEISNILEYHPLWNDWLKYVKGVGKFWTACIIAWIDDISRFPNVSKLWKYSGYAVIDGVGQRKRRGQRPSFNIKLKALFYKIGVNLLKAHSVYSEIYEKAKKYYSGRKDILEYHKKKAEESEKESVKLSLAGYKNHIHMMALRRMIKIFISHVWYVWRKGEGLEVKKPYPIDILGHSDYIYPLRDK